MESLAVNLLLLTALALPVVLFWLLRSRSRVSGLVAAAIAIAAGWALNLAYAFVVQNAVPTDPAQLDGDTLAIAAAFGWVCPSVLVLLTWLVWRRATRRMRAATPRES